ncbi:RidA family protein [Candidatus Poribacteria bacterium]|nr:RidA family protein [Candidatus Poribacteria bacterium]
MKIEKRLEELGITLPPPAKPVANYVTTVQTGNLVFTSGHGPGSGEGKIYKSQLGTDATVEDGYQSARVVAINLISTLKNALGDLDRIKRVVKVVGFVNSAPTFTAQPAVVNGASDLFVEVFGDKGRHARSAVGMSQLPGGIPVEIELVVEIEK